MNGEIVFELFAGFSTLIAAVVTLMFRNRPNSLIGVRIGYTYLSGAAWKKANTTGGIILLVLSAVLLLAAAAEAPITLYLLVLITGVIITVGVSTYVAKKAYELEDLSREAPEKPSGEPIKTNVKPYLLLQLIALGLYLLLVAFCWKNLPNPMASHFDASGNPNGFMSRFWGAIGVPSMVWTLAFGLTVMAKEPGFFARMKRFSPNGWRAWAEFMTLMNLGFVTLSSMTVLYNVKAVPGHWMSYSVWIFLAFIFAGIVLLARAGNDQGRTEV